MRTQHGRARGDGFRSTWLAKPVRQPSCQRCPEEARLVAIVASDIRTNGSHEDVTGD